MGTTVAPPPNVSVSIQGYGYQPQQLEIEVGTTVTWTNNDPIQHDIDEKNGIWESPLLSESETWSRTFVEPGKFLYICSIHPYMQALVTVR